MLRFSVICKAVEYTKKKKQKKCKVDYCKWGEAKVKQ